MTESPYKHNPDKNTYSNIELKGNPGDRERSPDRYNKYKIDQSRKSNAPSINNADDNKKKNYQVSMPFMNG